MKIVTLSFNPFRQKLHFFSSMCLIFTFVLFGCKQSDTEKQENQEANTYTLTVTNSESKINNVKIYSFWGNQQILIHEDSISSKNFSFDLTNHSFPAVFRIELDDKVFDVIYNQESIDITLTNEPGFEGIHIKESSENEHFYEFLRDFYFINENSTDDICNQVEMLRQKLTESHTEEYSHQLINFLLNSTYNCNKLEISKFIERLELDEELLSTPYISGQMETVVNSLYGQELEANELLQQLLKDDKGSNMNHFIRTVFWNVGIAKKQTPLITSIFNSSATDSIETDSLLHTIKNTFEIGDKFKFNEFGLNKSESTSQHLVFVYNSSKDDYDNVMNDFKSSLNSKEDISFYKVDIQNIPISLRQEFTILSTPLVLLIGKNNHLIDRFFSLEDVEHLLVQKL